MLVPHVTAADALRYLPRHPAGTISTKGNVVLEVTGDIVALGQ